MEWLDYIGAALQQSTLDEKVMDLLFFYYYSLHFCLLPMLAMIMLYFKNQLHKVVVLPIFLSSLAIYKLL